MAIYDDSKELKAATGADLMLRSAFKFEIETIEAKNRKQYILSS